jgi:elongation factor P
VQAKSPSFTDPPQTNKGHFCGQTTPATAKSTLDFNPSSPILHAPHPGSTTTETIKILWQLTQMTSAAARRSITTATSASSLDVQHRTPGNLRAFVQATLRSIRTGKSSDVRFSSTEKVETVPMMSKKMEFSYKDGTDFVFTDPENYETVTLVPEMVGDAKNYLVENGLVTVTFVDDKAVSVEIPPSVILTVTDAPEGVRGDSANNVQKAVTIETGITVQAPLFIKTGEKIKIDTRTGKYMERA